MQFFKDVSDPEALTDFMEMLHARMKNPSPSTNVESEISPCGDGGFCTATTISKSDNIPMPVENFQTDFHRKYVKPDAFNYKELMGYGTYTLYSIVNNSGSIRLPPLEKFATEIGADKLIKNLLQHILDLRLVPKLLESFTAAQHSDIDYKRELPTMISLVGLMRSYHLGFVRVISQYDEFWEFVHAVVCRPEIPKTAFGHSLICKLFSETYHFVPNLSAKQAKSLFDERLLVSLLVQLRSCHWAVVKMFLSASMRTKYGRPVLVNKFASAGKWHPEVPKEMNVDKFSLHDHLQWTFRIFNAVYAMAKNHQNEVRACPLEACFNARPSTKPSTVEGIIDNELQMIALTLMTERTLTREDVFVRHCIWNNHMAIRWNMNLNPTFDFEEQTLKMYSDKTLRPRKSCWNRLCTRKSVDSPYNPCEDDSEFRICSRCHEAYYCSRKCQKTHWKDGHRGFCGSAK
eukprot:191479_1